MRNPEDTKYVWDEKNFNIIQNSMKTKYNLETDVINSENTKASSKIVQKLNEFLTKKEICGSLYCGENVYRHLQFSEKFTVSELIEENLKFPLYIGDWSNEEKKINLYFSPEEYKENEFVIVKNENK